MPCPTLISPACIIGKAAGAATNAVASGAMQNIATTIQSGIGWVVSSTVDWWVKVASPNLAAEPAIDRIQQQILPVAIAVATAGMLAAAAKMAISRKATPLIDVGSGLAIIAATSALGVLLPSLLLTAGDSWSTWVLDTSTGGQFAARLTDVLQLSGATAGVVIVLGIVAMVMVALQAVLMMFRQGALVILAGLLPLAAAGTLTPATRSWFRRVTSWMLALIFYKPAAAAVYATAFTMIGNGRDPRTVLMGFAMVLLSIAALPALLRLFTWTTGTLESHAGGGFLSAAIGGAVAVGALRGSSGGSGGSSAVDQARLMSAQMGPQGGGPHGGGPHGAGPQASGPTGSGPHGSGPHGSGPHSTAGTGGGARHAAASTTTRTVTEAGPGWGAATGAGPAAGGPAGTGPAGSSPAGSGAASVGGSAAGRPARGAAGASAAACPTGAATGPAGMAASGLAEGAAGAARRSAETMQPPSGEGEEPQR